MAAWNEYKASGYRKPPGVEAGAVLDAGSDEPRCWWAPFDAIADNDYNLTRLSVQASRGGDSARRGPG